MNASRLVILALAVALAFPTALLQPLASGRGAGLAPGVPIAAAAAPPAPTLERLPAAKPRHERSKRDHKKRHRAHYGQKQQRQRHHKKHDRPSAGPSADTQMAQLCKDAGLIYLPQSGLCTHGPDPAPPGTDTTTSARPLPAALARVAAEAICDGDGQSGPRVQVLYAHASSVTSRFTQFLPSFRTWAAGADTVMQESAAEAGGSRRFRFVTTAGCQIDVREATLSAAGDDDFDTMAAELQSQGYNRSDRKYLVFLDTLWDGICGVGGTWVDDGPGQANWNNYGPSFAAVQASCWDNGQTPAHELMHTLGAVQDSAPNASRAGHCIDEYDVMCYPDDPLTPPMRFDCPQTAHDFRYDCNHNDYFNPAPPAGNYLATHWNAADNRFLVGGGDGGDDDGSPPTVTWTSPVGNDQTYPASSGAIPLVVTASDASGINRVEFSLYDAGTQTWETITTDRAAPFTADLAVADLPVGTNHVGAVAVDGVGDWSFEAIAVERTEQGGGGDVDPPTAPIQLVRARGIAFDSASPPALWVTSDATTSALLSRFGPDGSQTNYPYGDITSSEAIGQLAAEPGSSNVWMVTQSGDLAFIDSANLAGWQSLGTIKAIPVDTGSMYDVATGRVHNGNGVIQIAVSTFGDIALLKRASTFDAFITGESQAFPFVLRLRWSLPSGAFQSAKVVAYSSQRTPLRTTRGVAVNAAGTVLTTLPLVRDVPEAVDAGLFFHADFPEGGGISPVFLDDSLSGFTATGMTSDAAGRFYVPATTTNCGSTIDALLVFNATLTGGVCYPLPEPGFNMADVAVTEDGALAFVTSYTSGKVWQYILPAAPRDTSPPATPTLTLAEASGNDPDQHVSGTTLFYNPGAGRSGSFRVSATTSDPDSGIASVTFPAVFGGDGLTDTASPYTQTYAWSTGASASGAKTVTATNGEGLTSARSFTVTPDTAPPSVSLTAPAGGATVSNGATIGANASDAHSGVAQVEFRYCAGSSCTFTVGMPIGADPTAPYAATWSAQPADGVYTLIARATDNVGNVIDSTTRTVTVRNAPVDTTAPTTPALTLTESESDEHVSGTTLFYNPAAGHNGIFAVAADTDDPESEIAFVAFPVVFGGDAATDATRPYSQTYAWSAGANASGARTVTATNGDDLTASSTFTITPDTAGPTVSLTAPSSGATIAAGAAIEANAIDSLSAVAQVEFRYCAGASCAFAAGTALGSDQTAPYGVVWPAQPPDGQYTLVVRASDNVGNAVDSAPRTVTVRNAPVDDTAPTTPALTLSEDEPDEHASGARLYYNPSAGNSGVFTVRAETSDAQSGVQAVTFPVVFGGDGASDTTSPFMQTYTWTAAATASGARTVTATNGAGLTASADFTVTPDTAEPTVSIASPGAGTTITAGTSIGVNAADALAGVAGVEVRFCAGSSCAFASGTSLGSDDTAPYAVTWATLPAAGAYTIVARATDNVGNTADAATLTVRVGNRPPTGLTAGGPYTVNEGGSVVVTAAATDPDGDTLAYGWDLDANGEIETVGKSATFSAASLDGPATRQIGVATCDNVDCAVAVGSISIRNVAPSITRVTNTGPITAGSDATIAVTASDPASTRDPLTYEFDCDDNGQFEIGPQATSSARCTFATAGNRTVTVRVRDDDGGADTATTTVSVISAELAVTCTASESQSASLSGAACDGQFDTVWSSQINKTKKKKKGKKHKKPKPKPESAYVTFDLGAPGNDGPYTVGQIRWQVSRGCCDTLSVQTSTNGTTFQTIANAPGRPPVDTWYTLAGPSQAVRAVRLVMSAKNAKQVGFLREVEFCATTCPGSAGREIAAPTDAATTPVPSPAAEPTPDAATPPTAGEDATAAAPDADDAGKHASAGSAAVDEAAASPAAGEADATPTPAAAAPRTAANDAPRDRDRHAGKGDKRDGKRHNTKSGKPGHDHSGGKHNGKSRPPRAEGKGHGDRHQRHR